MISGSVGQIRPSFSIVPTAHLALGHCPTLDALNAAAGARQGHLHSSAPRHRANVAALVAAACGPFFMQCGHLQIHEGSTRDEERNPKSARQRAWLEPKREVAVNRQEWICPLNPLRVHRTRLYKREQRRGRESATVDEHGARVGGVDDNGEAGFGTTATPNLSGHRGPGGQNSVVVCEFAGNMRGQGVSAGHWHPSGERGGEGRNDGASKTGGEPQRGRASGEGGGGQLPDIRSAPFLARRGRMADAGRAGDGRGGDTGTLVGRFHEWEVSGGGRGDRGMLGRNEGDSEGLHLAQESQGALLEGEGQQVRG
ncbi:hypothetical protein B0H17DRAFT_1296827 [Mycena rosella]|uniref:Uncharacterized protein n=1 Tax=Mycena rosella TaxID=1033263 RepID=A0AAD7BE25_MYCRO|nr:hypothetical protein B0H17DRAFT_1296827 [Mycena rosella]